MSKILVSLVSEQSAPNIMFIKQFGDTIDKFLFLSTDQMETKGLTNSTINATQINRNSVATLLVDPHSFEDTSYKLNNFLTEIGLTENDEFLVNITLGTKMMSLGVYDFFVRRNNTKIFYIPMGFNVFRQIYPESSENLFEAKVSINEYLNSYGVNILSVGKIDFPVSSSDSIFKIFLNFQTEEHNILTALREVRNKKRILISEIPSLDSFLTTLNFTPQIAGALNKNEIKYLTGGWFEEWVYNCIKTKLNLFDNEMAIGVNTQLIADNDLDVVFMYKNELHVVECKTLMDDYLAENTIYKSGALNDKFGKNVHSHVFTLSDLRDKNSLLREKFRKRAEQQKIFIADKSDLTEAIMLNNFFIKNFQN